MNLFQNPSSEVVCNTIVCSGSASSYIENVAICNLRLIGNYKISCANTKGVYIAYGKNIHVHDMVIERCNFGIHTTIGGNDIPLGHCNQVKIDHVHIRDVVMGVQYNTVHYGSIEDGTISADYSSFITSPQDQNKNHCIYGSSGIQNCVFRNMILCNQKAGNAIILRGFNALSKDLLVENVEIDDCRKGIGLDAPVRYVTIRNVKATNIGETGINLSGAKHVIIKNSTFSGIISEAPPEADMSCGFTITSDNSDVAHIILDDCSFLFPHKFFMIGQDREDGCYDFRVTHCNFRITHPVIKNQNINTIAGYKFTPAYIKGIVSDICFRQCRFETDGFTTETHNHNGVFFFFDSALGAPNQQGVINTLNKMHWSFDNCAFINRGSQTVNSIFLSNINNDNRAGTVFCSIRNSLFYRFRWAIRIATIGDNAPNVLNPCFNDFDSSFRSSAKEALNLKKRFHASGNLFYIAPTPSDDPHYIIAEEFGIG